jgi:hypothetical protein
MLAVTVNVQSWFDNDRRVLNWQSQWIESEFLGWFSLRCRHLRDGTLGRDPRKLGRDPRRLASGWAPR